MSRRDKHNERALVRVYNFATLGRTDSAHALTAELKLLVDARAFSRRAWVTLWDLPSIHQYTLLPASRRNEATAVAAEHAASMLRIDPADVSLGLTQIAAPNAERKIALSFFGAASADIENRLRPVREAGFTVEGVATPCGALWALSRLRRAAAPGDVHAYVSLGATMSALAIIGSGWVLYARELNWGYAESFLGPGSVRPREELAARLAGELRLAFLYLKQFWEDDVSQLLICGDMPEIRSLTAPLIELLNIEVETLDSLDGIDTQHLPEPSDQFVDRMASLRLASAVAAAPPPVNLMPHAAGRHPGRTGRIAAALGAAAAIALAFLYHAWTTPADVRLRQAAAVHREIHAGPQSLPAAQKTTPKPIIDSRQSAVVSQQSSVDTHPSAVADRPPSRDALRRAGRSTPAPKKEPGRVSEPDPVVHTILYSSQHRAALVDGRIVRPGDYVGMSLVSDIEPNAVILMTDSGLVKRLPLEQPAIRATKQ